MTDIFFSWRLSYFCTERDRAMHSLHPPFLATIIFVRMEMEKNWWWKVEQVPSSWFSFFFDSTSFCFSHNKFPFPFLISAVQFQSGIHSTASAISDCHCYSLTMIQVMSLDDLDSIFYLSSHWILVGTHWIFIECTVYCMDETPIQIMVKYESVFELNLGMIGPRGLEGMTGCCCKKSSAGVNAEYLWDCCEQSYVVLG